MSRAMTDALVSFDPSQMWANFLGSFYEVKALNLWFITEDEKFVRFLLFFVTFSTICSFLREVHRCGGLRSCLETNRSRCLGLALLGLLYLGVQSVQIFRPEVTHYYRVVVFYAALWVLLMVWAVRFWIELLFHSRSFYIAFLLALAVSTCGMAQFHTLRDFAYLSMAEIDFMTTSLEPFLKGKASHAYLMRPVFNLYVRGDEHSMFTSHARTDYGMMGMLHRIYRNRNLDFSPIRLVLTPEEEGLVMFVNKNLWDDGNRQAVIVNFNDLLVRYRHSY